MEEARNPMGTYQDFIDSSPILKNDERLHKAAYVVWTQRRDDHLADMPYYHNDLVLKVLEFAHETRTPMKPVDKEYMLP